MNKDELKEALRQLDKEVLVDGLAAIIICLPIFSFMGVVASEQAKVQAETKEALNKAALSVNTTIPEEITKITKQLDYESIFKKNS